MKRNTLIFTAIAFVLSSCAQEAGLDSQAELYVRYDAQARKLNAEATFFDLAEGKKTTSQVFQGGVAFINSGMRTNTLPGGLVRYQYEVTGNLPANNYFVWKNVSGEEISAAAEIKPAADVTVVKDTISRFKGFQFKYDGEPLSASEKLVLVLVDKNRKALNFEIDGPSENSAFEVAPGKFASLADGACQLDLVRVRKDTSQQSGTKIFLTSEYYAQPVFTQITN